MRLVYLSTALLVTAIGCASNSEISDFDATAKYTKAKQIAEEQGQTPEGREYLGTMVSFWQATLNSYGQACQPASGKGVSLVVTINEQGVVEDAIGSPWNNKSKCLAKLVTGKKIAPPPIHPLYSKLDLP